jgi:hypothetical protein
MIVPVTSADAQSPFRVLSDRLTIRRKSPTTFRRKPGCSLRDSGAQKDDRTQVKELSHAVSRNPPTMAHFCGWALSCERSPKEAFVPPLPILNPLPTVAFSGSTLPAVPNDIL